MSTKTQFKTLFQGANILRKNRTPESNRVKTISPNTSSFHLNIKSARHSLEKQKYENRSLTKRSKGNNKQILNKDEWWLRQRNIGCEFQVIKNRIKNVLRRMKYKDKLNHLQVLVKEARSLSQKYGYFYVTGAMFIFKPETQIKLSLWIHPNLQQCTCMHPIRKQTETAKEKQFYYCLKMALKQIFPTISLGEGLTYTLIIDHIYQLQKNLSIRLQRSFSTNLQTTLTSPKQSSILMKASSNKVLKISRLIDFNEGISIIEEGDQEISILQAQTKKINKNNYRPKKGNLAKKFEDDGIKKRIQKDNEGMQKEKDNFQMSLSHFLKQDQGQYTLQDSKVRSNTSRQNMSSKLYNQLRKILNA